MRVLTLITDASHSMPSIEIRQFLPEATAAASTPHACAAITARSHALMSALEEGDALHVRSVREHVHHAGAGEPEPLRMHEDAGVAREGRRVAGDVQQALRPFRRQGLRELDRAFARRI